jgi:large subunit ribosomal protein L3
VPGAKGGWITVRDAVKKKAHKDTPKPGKFREAKSAEAPAADAAPAAKEGA